MTKQNTVEQELKELGLTKEEWEAQQEELRYWNEQASQGQPVPFNF